MLAADPDLLTAPASAPVAALALVFAVVLVLAFAFVPAFVPAFVLAFAFLVVIPAGNLLLLLPLPLPLPLPFLLSFPKGICFCRSVLSKRPSATNGSAKARTRVRCMQCPEGNLLLPLPLPLPLPLLFLLSFPQGICFSPATSTPASPRPTEAPKRERASAACNACMQ